MRSPLTDFHIKNEQLQKTTQIQIGEIWVNLRYDSFKNPDQKIIELSFEEDVSSGTFTKVQAEKLIEMLQKLVEEL